jgi:hypothetical protein
VDGFLREQLGYGEKDLVVNNDIGILYDVDEEENLPKKLTELGKTQTHFYCLQMLTKYTGIKNDSFLTVIDEDDDDAVVNVVINIQEGFVRPIAKTCELKLTNSVLWIPKRVRSRLHSKSRLSSRASLRRQSPQKPTATGSKTASTRLTLMTNQSQRASRGHDPKMMSIQQRRQSLPPRQMMMSSLLMMLVVR